MDASQVARSLNFSALFNFRDVGGYAGLDGRTVCWQRLYRSDSLHRLDEVDRAAFTALDVRTVVDLRRPVEVSRDGRVPAYEGLVYQHIHPEHADWDGVPYDEDQTVEQWLAERYLDLADTGRAGIAAAIKVIADQDAAPVVVHCLAGKDRTGVVCALTLSVLGVADPDIAEDYALSAAAAERFRTWIRGQYPHLPPFPAHYEACPPETMLRFLAGLREQHGSVEGYLRDAGLTSADFAALRGHLLA